MKTFKSFLTEATSICESIRQGLPHIFASPGKFDKNGVPSGGLDHEQAKELTKTGVIHLNSNNVTEKTDGTSFVFGHDHKGFFTQSTASGSNRMYDAQDHVKRALDRAKETGKEPSLAPANAFAKAHAALQNNVALQQHLKSEHDRTGHDVLVRGELLHQDLTSPGNTPDERRFIGTSYNTKGMGSVGRIILHTKLPENANHNADLFKHNLSNKEIDFDDDKIHMPDTKIDVHHEAEQIRGLNHDLLSSRTTPSNKEAKVAEQMKLSNILKGVHKKVSNAVASAGARPKWGSESEGLVLHLPGVRTKLQDENFGARKEATGTFNKD